MNQENKKILAEALKIFPDPMKRIPQNQSIKLSKTYWEASAIAYVAILKKLDILDEVAQLAKAHQDERDRLAASGPSHDKTQGA